MRSRGWQVAVIVIVAAVAAVAVCEAIGWPFLVGPMQRRIAVALDRRVELGDGAEIPRIGLLGSVRMNAHRVRVGAPAWSSTPHTFLAQDAFVRLRYRDLWHAYRTGQLRIDAVSARQFDARFERLADGRASWNFKPHQPAAGGSITDLPVFGHLNVADGTLELRDAMTPLDLSVHYTLDDGTAPPASAASAPASQAPQVPRHVRGLWLSADGHYKNNPLKIQAETDGVLVLEAPGAGARKAQPLRVDALAGQAKIVFVGSVLDPLHLDGLRGSFEAGGPSLSAAGEPLGVTLPTTPKFDLNGRLAKDGEVWNVVIDAARIGSSRLQGAFVFDHRPQVPSLSGRLQGARLALADLGPAVGAVTHGTDRAHAPAASGRIFPERPFDLPSLRVMNANVLFDLKQLDLGTSALAPFEPARAHIVVDRGLLTLTDLDLRTAQGRLGGTMALDGRRNPAAWRADLDVNGVQLDRFVALKRAGGAPPYVAGRLDGRLKANSDGRSVAEILGNMYGQLMARVEGATVSHLALKAVGLDVAGGIKVLVQGDDSLPVHCNVAHLVVRKGVIRPRPLVVSLDNATVWADGYVSLGEETMDLQVVSAPKNFTPLSLRTPIALKGPLSKPSVSIEPSHIVARAGAAALLALLNPLAAVVPFADPGARDAAHAADRDCAEFVKSLPATGGGDVARHGVAAGPHS